MVQVGDSVRIRPFMSDEFDNPVCPRSGSLIATITSTSGEEAIPILSVQSRGVWVHELQYDLRIRGRHKLEITLDDVPIAGCPVEWTVKHRIVA